MLVTKKERELVYNQIFRDGVLVVKKKNKKINDKEIQLENIITIKLLKGLLSRGYVTEKFSWKVYYFTLNEKGVEYLRSFLNLPPEVVPLIYKNPRI
nr:40S ribosomal protein S10B [Cryptomonas sp.]